MPLPSTSGSVGICLKPLKYATIELIIRRGSNKYIADTFANGSELLQVFNNVDVSYIPRGEGIHSPE